jgi:hypothetical protein
MLRATVWTVGLFGAGTALSRLFPGTWTEPLVLLGLGIALLFVSARTARGTAKPARAARPAAAMAAKVAAQVAAPASAPVVAAAAAASVQRAVQAAVQVERTA